tara:strand:- start:12676 stop:13566 length:891 start_codon:yes stop_codon:yes gene_type:complete
MIYWEVFKKTVKEYKVQEAMNYSSSIAFYLIFSLPAILIITVSIASSAYGDEIVRQNLIQEFQNLFGPESAQVIDRILSNSGSIGSSWITKIIGLVTLLVSATTVFASLQDGLNRIWGLEPKPEKNLISFIKNRLLSLAMAISMGFLLLFSLILDTFLTIFEELLISSFSESIFNLVIFVNVVLGFIIIMIVFAGIFRILPDAKIAWKDVLSGAILTTFIFSIGKYAIGYYLGTSDLMNVYGAAGSFVLLLIWVYFSSMILFFGATYTEVYFIEKHGQVKPYKRTRLVDGVDSQNT